MKRTVRLRAGRFLILISALAAGFLFQINSEEAPKLQPISKAVETTISSPADNLTSVYTSNSDVHFEVGPKIEPLHFVSAEQLMSAIAVN